ncbi:Protein of unknown function [Verrucomicrobium sp. GAS474]|uniref:DUF1656 domain-containing protein n=1 Tax=Verrucomicrobium sp. GAS474 TaxID=1882831 RepID=UPI000879BA23|nr:DUF1656 domain-containing protein [Verrucomicrobium sp. GAS474]SDT95260.1 Protein of unknown function [Verrucomicrobium sp. GAS474]
MMKEWNIGGVFLAPIVGYLVAAIALYLGTRSLFLRDIERRVWHPSLFKLSVFIILLTVIVLLF